MTSDSGRTRAIVLASTSPRRKEILTLLGLPFQTVSPRFEEILSAHRSIMEEVTAFAEGKARSVLDEFPESILIGSDTLIDCEGKKIGKPRDTEEAKQILQLLSGRTHRIWTAVCLIDPLQPPAQMAVETIDVTLKPMKTAEIEAYVATGEPLDKAGAYSLQGEGRRFIERLEGDYLAAVGLPLRPIVSFLQSRRIAVPLDPERLYREKTFMNWKTF
ncbi:MAG: septum formation protein Maf [Nitrospirae bacterium]|nr:septum formation protein Maf [Candidatus Manganitrophaceae bacterium]